MLQKQAISLKPTSEPPSIDGLHAVVTPQSPSIRSITTCNRDAGDGRTVCRGSPCLLPDPKHHKKCAVPLVPDGNAPDRSSADASLEVLDPLLTQSRAQSFINFKFAVTVTVDRLQSSNDQDVGVSSISQASSNTVALCCDVRTDGIYGQQRCSVCNVLAVQRCSECADSIPRTDPFFVEYFCVDCDCEQHLEGSRARHRRRSLIPDVCLACDEEERQPVTKICLDCNSGTGFFCDRHDALWHKSERCKTHYRVRYQNQHVRSISKSTCSNLGVQSSQHEHIGEDDGQAFPIFFKDHRGNTRTLKVQSSDTVARVKTFIQEKFEISYGRQRLIFAGKQLEDDRTLRDYRIGRQDTLHLILRIQCSNQDEQDGGKNDGPAFPIFFKDLQGETRTLQVQLSDTVARVKTFIQDELDIFSDQQRLIFAGIPLEDDRTLRYYQIERGNTLHLMLRLKGDIGFFEVAGADHDINPESAILTSKHSLADLAPASITALAHAVLAPSSRAPSDAVYFSNAPVLSPLHCAALMAVVQASWTHGGPSGLDASFVESSNSAVASEAVGVVGGSSRFDYRYLLAASTLRRIIGDACMASLLEALESVRDTGSSASLSPLRIDDVVFALRRTEAEASGKVIRFHFDSALMTAQVPLSSVEDTEGGRTVYALKRGELLVPDREAGRVMAHHGDVAHGVTVFSRGVRFGLYALVARAQ